MNSSILSTFNVGDKVRCVDTTLGTAFLKSKRTFRIRDCGSNWVSLQGDAYAMWWSVHRFEKVKPNGKKR